MIIHDVILSSKSSLHVSSYNIPPFWSPIVIKPIEIEIHITTTNPDGSKDIDKFTGYASTTEEWDVGLPNEPFTIDMGDRPVTKAEETPCNKTLSEIYKKHGQCTVVSYTGVLFTMVGISSATNVSEAIAVGFEQFGAPTSWPAESHEWRLSVAPKKKRKITQYRAHIRRPDGSIFTREKWDTKKPTLSLTNYKIVGTEEREIEVDE